MYQISMFVAPVLALSIYSLFLVIYRLFFHPLARFPGPKLAATTEWYEAWFEFIKPSGGTFMFEVDKMHDSYGPIVRVNPHEIHIRDTSFIPTLYTTHEARDKYWPAAMVTGTPNSIFGTVHHDIHRKRRAAVNNLFSKKSVDLIEPVLQEFVGRLSRNFLLASRQSQEIELGRAYLATTTDVVCQHTLGKSLGFSENPEATDAWKRTMRAVAGLTPMAKQFPWMIPLALNMPSKLLRNIAPDLDRVVELHRYMKVEAEDALLKHDPDRLLPKAGLTVFESCLASGHLAPDEKRADRLAAEAFTVIAAGGEVSARALSTASFHIIANKDRVLSVLRKELENAFPDPEVQLDLKTLERLPWLTAVIKESLRVTTLVVSRLPLVAPNALHYKEWLIPPGTPVSMSLRDVLLDGSIFERPTEFRPERWLAEKQNHARCFLPFGRGSRMCLGLHLAMAELYLILGTMFRRFDMDLYHTVKEDDVDVARDCFIGEPKVSSLGIRVKANPVPGYGSSAQL